MGQPICSCTINSPSCSFRLVWCTEFSLKCTALVACRAESPVGGSVGRCCGQRSLRGLMIACLLVECMALTMLLRTVSTAHVIDPAPCWVVHKCQCLFFTRFVMIEQVPPAAE